MTDPSLMNAVEVSGEIGSQPTVDFPMPFVAENAEHADVEQGDGPVIESMQQAVRFDATLYEGTTGVEIPLTTYSGDQSQVLGLSALVEQLPGLESAFECASEGSRVVAALGKEGLSEAFAQQITQYGAQTGAELDPTRMIAVVDVHRVVPGAADGAHVYNDGHGLPSVVRTPDGVPGVIVPDGAAPTDQVTQTLLKGDGDAIGEGDLLTVQMTSVDWSTRSVSTNTWESGAPATTTADQLPEGVPQALEGATVGSQIMTIVPGQGGSATITVIDVLGAVAAG